MQAEAVEGEEEGQLEADSEPEVQLLVVPPPPSRSRPETPAEESAPSSQTKKRPRTPRYLFTDEQEKDIGEWFRENECLYNRRLNAYKDAKKKQRLLEEKAATIPDCTCEYLNVALLNCTFNLNLKSALSCNTS